LKCCPTPRLLGDLFGILAFIASLQKPFDFPDSLLADLISIAQIVKCEDPSLAILSHLLGLLSGSPRAYPVEPFLIVIPSIIPLLLTVFGRSPKLERLLSFFVVLCEFSDHNIIMCHHGDLDYILLKFLCAHQNEVLLQYRQFRIVLQILPTVVSDSVWPLITVITRLKSSSAISSLIVEHLISTPDVSLLQSVLRLFTQADLLPKSIFVLGSGPSAFEAKGLFGPDLNDGFTVLFRLRVDLELFSQSQLRLRLLSITDSEENVLTVFFKEKNLVARYDGHSF
jgi:hypothetical protein